MSEPTQQASNPALYTAPEMLSRSTHQNLKLLASNDYAFARSTAAVPVVISELAAAAAHYPIVFMRGNDGAQPMALLGANEGENSFVDAEGQWRADTYIPAYVRRYPFVFATDTSTDTLVLFAEVNSDRFSEDEGEPLFNDGEPTATTSRALSFCNNFQRDHALTREWVSKLQELSLLSDQRLTIRRGGQPTKVLEGLQLLDRQTFRDLPDGEFLELRRAGFLGPIYSHLASLHSLRYLC